MPSPHQAIIWTSAGILFIGPLGRNFNESLIEIHTFSLRKMHLKMLSGKWRPFCLCLNLLGHHVYMLYFLTLFCCNINPSLCSYQFCCATLLWYHMSTTASQITGNLTVCSTGFHSLTVKKTLKHHITGYERNPPVTGGFRSLYEGILPKRALSAMRKHGR